MARPDATDAGRAAWIERLDRGTRTRLPELFWLDPAALEADENAGWAWRLRQVRDPRRGTRLWYDRPWYHFAYGPAVATSPFDVAIERGPGGLPRLTDADLAEIGMRGYAVLVQMLARWSELRAARAWTRRRRRRRRPAGGPC